MSPAYRQYCDSMDWYNAGQPKALWALSGTIAFFIYLLIWFFALMIGEVPNRVPNLIQWENNVQTSSLHDQAHS